MRLEECNQLLQAYKKQLNEISQDDVDYKLSIACAVNTFFNKIKKLDKDFLKFYFNTATKENIIKSEVKKYAFDYLFLLVIKNTKIPELFARFFPEYLQSQPIVQSNWRIIYWIKKFFSWLFKPKLNLHNSQEANNLLKAIRNIQSRMARRPLPLNLEIEYFSLEMTEYSAFDSIIEKFFKKSSSIIPTIFYGNEFLEKKENFFEVQLEFLSKNEIREVLDVINLRLFDTDIKKILKEKNNYFQQYLASLEAGIEKRTSLIPFHTQATYSNKDLKTFTSEFKQSLTLNISQIQFIYQFFNKNFNKIIQKFDYGNLSALYKNLTELGKILYQDENLFFHTINQDSSRDYITGLSKTLDTLEKLAKPLQFIAKKEIDSKTLAKDILEFSGHILCHISVIKENMKPYTKNVDFIMRGGVSCKDFSSTSDFETEFDTSDVISLDSAREEAENYPRHYRPFYHVTLSRKKLSDDEVDSAYSDASSQLSFFRK